MDRYNNESRRIFSILNYFSRSARIAYFCTAQTFFSKLRKKFLKNALQLWSFSFLLCSEIHLKSASVNYQIYTDTGHYRILSGESLGKQGLPQCPLASLLLAVEYGPDCMRPCFSLPSQVRELRSYLNCTCTCCTTTDQFRFDTVFEVTLARLNRTYICFAPRLVCCPTV